ncbi:MAG: sulfotransferase domain-containing protein [Steroidobacteraceae bacterium]
MNIRRFARQSLNRIESLAYARRRTIDNLYLATVQKCGSQWVSAIFNDRRMRAHTGLVRMPQRYYEYGEHVSRFPRGFFVPGLYVSYQTFENFIEKPENYRVVYVYRDPRDLVISDYYSTLKTHEDNPAVVRLRTRLKSMSKEDGIKYMIKYNDKFSVLRSWVELGTVDKKIMFVKFEELTEEPVASFRKILAHCDVEMSDETLMDILQEYTKDRMRKRDLAGRADKSESHYRFQASSHLEEFNDDHYVIFRAVTGNLLEVLGYQ